MNTLKCGMGDCQEPVTHMDNKGHLFCTMHGKQRRYDKPCRQLLKSEIKQLANGESIWWQTASQRRRAFIDRSRREMNLSLPEWKHRHLFGVTAKGNGFFIVNRAGMVLDRRAFKEIIAEANSEGLIAPYFVYCRIASYQGPNLEIMQVGPEGGSR